MANFYPLVERQGRSKPGKSFWGSDSATFHGMRRGHLGAAAPASMSYAQYLARKMRVANFRLSQLLRSKGITLGGDPNRPVSRLLALFDPIEGRVLKVNAEAFRITRSALAKQVVGSMPLPINALARKLNAIAAFLTFLKLDPIALAQAMGSILPDFKGMAQGLFTDLKGKASQVMASLPKPPSLPGVNLPGIPKPPALPSVNLPSLPSWPFGGVGSYGPFGPDARQRDPNVDGLGSYGPYGPGGIASYGPYGPGGIASYGPFGPDARQKDPGVDGMNGFDAFGEYGAFAGAKLGEYGAFSGTAGGRGRLGEYAAVGEYGAFSGNKLGEYGAFSGYGVFGLGSSEMSSDASAGYGSTGSSDGEWGAYYATYGQSTSATGNADGSVNPSSDSEMNTTAAGNPTYGDPSTEKDGTAATDQSPPKEGGTDSNVKDAAAVGMKALPLLAPLVAIFLGFSKSMSTPRGAGQSGGGAPGATPPAPGQPGYEAVAGGAKSLSIPAKADPLAIVGGTKGAVVLGLAAAGIAMLVMKKKSRKAGAA